MLLFERGRLLDYLWYLVEDFFSSYFIPVNKYTQDYTCPAFSICQVHTFSRSVSQKTRCLLDNSVACTFSLIKMSSPNINNIMAVGCIMCYACVFLLGADSLLDQDSQITTHSTLCKVRDFSVIVLQFSFNCWFACYSPQVTRHAC